MQMADLVAWMANVHPVPSLKLTEGVGEVHVAL